MNKKRTSEATSTSSMTSLSTQCPHCSHRNLRQVVGQRAVCRPCSLSLRRVYQFCSACQREWSGSGGDSCMLPGCGTRAALLSPKLVGKGDSLVKECPFFRACPTCRALLTHSGEGCQDTKCVHCGVVFCFRCLRKSYESDLNDDDSYDSCEEEKIDDSYCIGGCDVVDNSESIKALDKEWNAGRLG